MGIFSSVLGKFLNFFEIDAPKKERIVKDTVIWIAAFEIGKKKIKTQKKKKVALSKYLKVFSWLNLISSPPFKNNRNSFP